MKVLRIVSNIETADINASKLFYGVILGLDILMDHGWLLTYGNDFKMNVQINIANEGGRGAPTPDLSIEVDDLDTAHTRMLDAGFTVEYGPMTEPWGVRRFFVRDPFNRLVNILSHLPNSSRADFFDID